MEGDPEREQNGLGFLPNQSYATKISMALKALPESPTSDMIADWILDNVPPPPEYIGQSRATIFRKLRDKFSQTEEGDWIEVKKSSTRTPIEPLVAVAFYKRSFQPSSAEQIRELIKDDFPGESKPKVIATIVRHLKYAQKRYRKDGTIEEVHKKKPRDAWHVRRELKEEIEFQARMTLNEEKNLADPGLTFPQLVVEALEDGSKNWENLFCWISRKYPFHIRSKKKIQDAVYRLKLPKEGGCYHLRDGIKLLKKKKRKERALPNSSFQPAAKRMRVNVNGNYPSLFQCISKLTCN